MTVDTVITGGLIVDGTGSPGYHGTVLIDDQRVTILRGHTSALDSQRVIDAAGLVVCPGFIDLHSHAGLTILSEPHHDPKVRQGVTTELIGVDGISHAPFQTTEELRRYIWLDSGLNGRPPGDPDWLTVGQLLSRYDRHVAINICYILGNPPVRIWSVGWEQRPATPAQITDMQAVVRESMTDGAWGLSTGLDYPPGSYADTDELIALSRTAASLGGFYHTEPAYSAAASTPPPTRRWTSVAAAVSPFTSPTTASRHRAPGATWTTWGSSKTRATRE